MEAKLCEKYSYISKRAMRHIPEELNLLCNQEKMLHNEKTYEGYII